MADNIKINEEIMGGAMYRGIKEDLRPIVDIPDNISFSVESAEHDDDEKLPLDWKRDMFLM